MSGGEAPPMVYITVGSDNLGSFPALPSTYRAA
jgi:hypothetical protein